MPEITFHIREFTKELQQIIKDEAKAKNYVWRGFENIELVSREIRMCMEMAKKQLPEVFHEHIGYKIDPFSYCIEFYLPVGYDDGY